MGSCLFTFALTDSPKSFDVLPCPEGLNFTLRFIKKIEDRRELSLGIMGSLGEFYNLDI